MLLGRRGLARVGSKSQMVPTPQDPMMMMVGGWWHFERRPSRTLSLWQQVVKTRINHLATQAYTHSQASTWWSPVRPRRNYMPLDSGFVNFAHALNAVNEAQADTDLQEIVDDLAEEAEEAWRRVKGLSRAAEIIDCNLSFRYIQFSSPGANFDRRIGTNGKICVWMTCLNCR